MANASPSIRPAAGESGFTLIELLVSLTILTFILGILSSALHTLSQNWNSNANGIERLEMVSRAFDIFQRDVSGFRRLVQTSDNGKRFIFTGTENRLSFVTTEPAYPTSPGAYYVNYSVSRNGPSMELVRARAPYQAGMRTFPGATPANSVSIMQGAFKYQFSYARKDTRNGSWLAFWRKTNALPDLVRLKIIDARTGGEVAQPFVAAFRTDAELNCLSQGSDSCTARTNGEFNQDNGVGSPLAQTGK
jgi:general secretion pathway protein J